ncbi:solute carrier family 23 protein, partial [Nocardioides albidus]|uniref:solute carrier family 23 protein n=1 Tax=Nocardioides albidus TaxID=1517589 RepID=UPI001F00BF34
MKPVLRAGRREPSERRAPVHPVDEVLPAGKLAVYGMQHVLAFYAGAVIVPILLANSIGLSTEQLIHLINADLFTCGIASIIQSVGFWKVGVRLPLLQGVTFTAVSPMIAIGLAAGGGTDGLLVIYGAVIVAGIATFLIAPYFSRLIRFFPPVVTGSVITIIGLALLPVAAADATGGAGPTSDPTNGRNLAYAVGTLALIVVIQRVFKGFMATVAVLVGLVVGTLVAWSLGDAHFDSVSGSDWVGVTTPFHFGWPQFSAAAIVSMIVVMLITAVETTGDVFATGEIVEKRIGREDIARALRADGLATTIGGTFNSFPYTCFAENVGLVRLTRVKSRWVVASAGLIMVLIGLVPKAGAVVAGIPHPVLGGAALAMFATVAVVGFQTLGKVDFHDHRNVVIVATSVGLAMYVTAQPQVSQAVPDWAEIIFGSGITLGSLTAIVLNIVFHHVGKDFGPAVAGLPGDTVRLDQVNQMSRAEFVDTFASLFQGPSWMVERAWEQRPFADTHALRRAFQETLFGGSEEEQRQLIEAYPELGSRLVAAGITGEASLRDQSTRGLTHLSEPDEQALAELTEAYHQRFGFPLVISVR